MRIPKVCLANQARKLCNRNSFQALEKLISKLQKEIIDVEISSIQAIYGIKIDKSDYKKYKLG